MVHQNADLIGQLGDKTNSEGDNKPQPKSQTETDSKVEASASAATEQASDKGSPGEKKEETSDGVKNPDSWSKESALKEVQKLREENKAQRLKYNESLEAIKKEQSEKAEPLKQQLEELVKYKEKLEKMEAEEADKKRGLEEKVSYRDTRIGELEAQIQSLQSSKEQELEKAMNRLSELEAREEARKQVYVERLQKELESIPEKFREQAELMTRGAGDPSEALVALNEAKLKGLFEDKTVVVNHSVPGANEGARASQDQLDQAAREKRESMSSTDKVRTALKEIRSGNTNSAFRTN